VAQHRDDRTVVLSQDQAEGLKVVLLQLLGFITSQDEMNRVLRDNLIWLARQMGVSPKDLIKTTNLSNSQIHAIIGKGPPRTDAVTPYMRRMLLSIVEGR